MAINYDKLREILERKANKAIGYLDELKCFVPEFKEVLDSVLYISETLNDLRFLDTECTDCKKKPEAPVEAPAPQPTQPEDEIVGRPYFPLDQTLTSNTMAVLFYSDGCAPCQKMKPVFKQAVEELNVPVELISVDDAIGESHARDYGITGWPSIFLVREGIIVQKIPGYNMNNTDEENKADLKNTIRHYLNF